MPLIKRYLLRDYSQFPAAAVRYWVLSNSEKCPYFWVNETSDILDEFLQLEEANGCIPEQGITSSNIDAVKQHKEQVYLQHPAPILINTWRSSKLPFQVRKRPTSRPPASLINAVVQDHFHVSDTETAYYQGLVLRKQKPNYVVQWTDGYEQTYTPAEIQSLLYDPVSYVYNFNQA
eukprot:scaffold3760_cov1014-Pavlova_lutheri.AAC.1